MDRRIGAFEVTKDLVDTGQIGPALAAFCFVTLDVKFDPVRQIYRMTGISSHFEEIKEGQTVPTYHIGVEPQPGKDPRYFLTHEKPGQDERHQCKPTDAAPAIPKEIKPHPERIFIRNA